MLTKKDIRKEYLEKRLNLPDAVTTTLNGQLLEQFRQLDYSSLRLAHIFLPITEKKEVNTHALVHWAREAWPALKWVLPKSDLKTGQMQHFLWEPQTILEKNKYGIPEPENGTLVEPSAIDLVFVPLLAFDKTGHRVGYGKGMYDRFLSECRPDAITIGLSLFDPVDKITDTDALDVPLKMVITPDAIYHFSKS
ncbi:5-formyltetrahydrofolate cyclo-ligase [Chitinophaga sp. CF118]|uniref:5-formyltetrahydrofolate cyclo-ligase n=1 Tax=Chitinophaga sp. CF118 TaxID=1884367 RepID=UPI0008F390DC|nr:5-formyltetrahydrofolate cyclo-ligase [Chitinophaga sp. CF118]SFE91963.1 5-formyltetrahydrofolate cyclo-ligase [Chitinophaga sp. CF118]